MRKNYMKEHKNPYFILVFQDETNLACLKLLKRGFRHCFLYQVNNHREIIKIDSLSNLAEINIIKDMNPVSLINHMRKQGNICILLPHTHPAPKRMAPFLPMTCVEMVKRVIGLHSWFILTPWQLYKYSKEQIMNINIDI